MQDCPWIVKNSGSAGLLMLIADGLKKPAQPWVFKTKIFHFFGLTPTVSVTREIARSNVDIAKYETTDWFFGKHGGCLDNRGNCFNIFLSESEP